MLRPGALDPRRSFAAKLVVALLATVGLLLGITLLVVRGEMDGQVERVAERTVARASEAFADSEARRREQLAQRARVFTDTRRSVALLQAAIEARDTAYLTAQIGYALQLTQFDSSSLTVLTDGYGEAILTLLGDSPAPGDDPVGVGPLVDELLDSFDTELVAYRLVDGRLYTVRVVLLELANQVVGATAFGLPITDDDAEALGRLVGAEVCFVARGRCVAGTARARSQLAPVLTSLEGTVARRMGQWGGERWELLADPLVAGAADGWLVMAVPLEAVLAPFDRIRRALGLASLAALLVAVILSIALSRGLTRPVRSLVDATRRVARGEYETRVPEESRDELGQLARAFNQMTEGLELKEQYRGVLDKVVSREVAEELLRGEVRLGGENREVSILFADVRGFTALTERMEPQSVIALLNDTMQRLSAAVDEVGGVVDKYIGDQIMAVFGAPMAQPDHAARAVAAAGAMHRAMAAMNEARTGRGEPVVAIGTGIHSGVAVAGNMGSHDRLNYTVLGEAVNLAARLCSVAGPGEILISESTRAGLDGAVRVRPAGDRELKGFSRRVSVFAVEPDSVPTRPVAAGRATGALVAGLLAAAAAGWAGPAAAQELPTLAGLGVGYISPGGAVQLDLSGRLDLEAYRPGARPAWIIPDTDPFLAGRLRLFGDLFLGDRVFVGAELRVDRGEEPTAGPADVRLEQLFARVTAGPGFVQAGRIVSPAGGYPSRHHTPDDPLIRPALKYEWRTMVSAQEVPGNPAGFVGWKDEPDRFRPIGAPPIWGAPYPWGVVAGVAVGPATAQVAVLNSAPSSEPEQWTLAANPFDRPTWQAVGRYRVRPELGVLVYHSRGPYLEGRVDGPMPGAATVADFDQVLWGAELHFQQGLTTVRLEALHDRWEVPNLPEDPVDVSYAIEARQRLGGGFALAGRYSAIAFKEIDAAGPDYDGSGPRPRGPWDYDARRLQVGVSYRVTRALEVRAEQGWTRTASPHDEDASLASVQVWWSF